MRRLYIFFSGWKIPSGRNRPLKGADSFRLQNKNHDAAIWKPLSCYKKDQSKWLIPLFLGGGGHIRRQKVSTVEAQALLAKQAYYPDRQASLALPYYVMM